MERKTGLREVIWGAKRPKFTASNGVWDDKGIAPKQVNVTLMNEGGKTPDICFINGVALLSKFRECGIHIDGIPQHEDVDDETKSTQLVFLPFPVSLPQFSTFSVEDFASKTVASFATI